MNTDNAHAVTIVMIEDDDGHARLIERNIRRAGVTNEIVPLTNGHAALEFLLGEDGSGTVNSRRALLVLLDLNLPDMSGVDILQKIEREIQRCYDLGANVYITKPVNYESFANAIRQLGLFVAVMQVPCAE
jgi:DNA-binding response OmpR family regulator